MIVSYDRSPHAACLVMNLPFRLLLTDTLHEWIQNPLANMQLCRFDPDDVVSNVQHLAPFHLSKSHNECLLNDNVIHSTGVAYQN